MSKKNQKSAAPAPAESVMYVGPSIRGVIATATVFNNGFPEIVNRKIEECPSLTELFVPVSEVGAALKDIQNKEGAISVFYGKVVAHFNKED